MRRRSFLAVPALIAYSLTVPLRAAAGTGASRLRGFWLIMVDRAGCPYCAAWKRDILPGYHLHRTGRDVPLRIVPLDGPWPDGIALDRSPSVTPSFLLMQGQMEVARIEGYPGANLFWPRLAALLADAPTTERRS